jgi:uncharacterized protein YceK
VIQACTEKLPFDWIESDRLPLEDPYQPWRGNTVANLLPQTFEAYVKVLHRINPRFDWLDNPLSPEEIRILQLPACSQLEEFVIGIRDRKAACVRWREICQLLDLPFSEGIVDEWLRQRLEPECWPRYFYGPPDCCAIEREELIDLIRIISLQHETEDCFFRLPEVPYIGTDKPLLYQANLKDLPDLLEETPPEYWWPSDQEWCVCSDYDLPFTIVAGGREMIDQIITSQLLETVLVTPSTRIDYKSPIT